MPLQEVPQEEGNQMHFRSAKAAFILQAATSKSFTVSRGNFGRIAQEYHDYRTAEDHVLAAILQLQCGKVRLLFLIAA